MNTELTIEQESASFELMQRQAKMLSASTLVPKDFQGNMANCAIGLNLAKRLGADGFMVIQTLDVIHGRPSFRGKFLIAMVNASGRFSPLKFRFDGEKDDYGCTAYATDKDTGETIEGPKVDWNMVKGEGWLGKPGSKWKTMPDLMFRYRAGAYFANIYAPDITLGMMTAEEAEDIAPSIRPASGRVVTGDAPKLVNPYAEPEPESQPDPELPPAQDAEPAHESPMEVSEETERAKLIDDIKLTCSECEITLATFGGRAKNVGLMDAKQTVRDISIEQLRAIHDTRLAIAQDQFGKGEA